MHVLFKLHLPSDVESVPLVRGLINSAMTELGIDERSVSDVAIAITEACSNVINHARGRGEDYEVQVEIDPESCHIRVIDTGEGFDPVEVEAGGDFAEGGRGMMLMRATMDKLDFVPRQGKGGTIVHLTKLLMVPPGSPLRSLAGADGGETRRADTGAS